MTEGREHMEGQDDREVLKVFDKPLFEIRGRDGHIWRLFENGRVQGFPDGVIVLNGAVTLLDGLRARIMRLERTSITGEKTETIVS